MDPNDQKRRLQVLQASSPSLRVAAAPTQQPELTVRQTAPVYNLGPATTAQQDNTPLNVVGPKPSVSSVPTINQNKPKNLTDYLASFGGELVNGGEQVAKGAASLPSILQGIARIPETLGRSINSALPANMQDPEAAKPQDVNNPVRQFFYGADPVQTYQEQDTADRQALKNATGVDVAPGVLGTALAGLDLGGLGLGAVGKSILKKTLGNSAKDVIEGAAAKQPLKEVAEDAAREGLKNLPEEDLAAIREAGGAQASAKTNIPEGAIPQTDIEAIQAAGGQVPKTPSTVLHLPDLKVHAKLTPEQVNILKDEVKNIPFSATDRPHLTAGEKVLQNTTEVTPEELAKLSPNAGRALETANKQIAEAKKIEEVKNAQTGAATADVAGDIPSATKAEDANAVANVATPAQASDTLAEGKGIKFRDPETKKQILRSYEDVQAELSKLQDLPTEKRDASVRDRINSLQNKLAKFRSENAGYSPRQYEAPTNDAVQQVMDSFDSANRRFNTAEKARAQERASRIGEGNKAYASAGGGEAGIRAKLAQLKGKQTASTFNPINIPEDTQKILLDDIQNSQLRDFEKLNTQNALRKIWGTNPEKPTPSDINYIRKYFGDEMANNVEQAVKEAKGPDGWRERLAKIAATPRAALATGDLSGIGRQGLALGLTDPKQYAKSAKDSIEFFGKKDNFDARMKEIRESDAYSTIKEKMKVALTGAEGGTEEAFAGADYAEAVPILGKVVRGSDRAYAGLLTDMRYNAALKPIQAAGGVDNYLDLMKSQFGDKADDAMKAYGEAINTLSGRGGKQGGLIDKHMGTLSTTLFAPRLWAANLSKINPLFYARLYKENPEAAKLAIRGTSSQLAFAGGLMGLAAAVGGTVGMDPRSADFGKIKFGNTRFDVLGGMQQNIVLASRLLTGEKVNSETGDVATLGDGITTPNRIDLLYQAFENKENPLLAFATRLLKTTEGDTGNPIDRKDEFGQDFNLLGETAKLVTPLNIQGIVDTTNDTGNIASGIGMNLPGFIGAGVQTYGSASTKDANGNVTYTGEIKPNMVTDSNGQAVLDAKGKPVTVTIPKDATPTQIKALKDAKLSSALKTQFTSKQSQEDQSLMKLSDTALAKEVKDGTISQDKADQIQRLSKQADNAASVKVPDGAQSEEAVNFYRSYNSLDTKDQKAYLDGPADSNATAVATKVNAERSNGLDEFKPSNQLSKLYADYENDLNTHSDYTKLDLRNKAKAFQSSAAKLNYSQDQRDIYQEGPSDDLKSLMQSGDVSKSDLDQAIKLDDQLYSSGLSSSLKFSKKFRGENGYGVPSKGGGSGGSSSTNQHLASYLPSSKGSTSAVPKFSAKPRSTKVSFKNVSIPKTGGKKISIKL